MNFEEIKVGKIYRVETNQYGYHIEDSRNGNVIAVYGDELLPNAFEVAGDDCELLNEQYRKEQSND